VIGFVAILRGMAGAAIMWVGWLISVVANAHDSLYVESIFQSRYMFAIGLQAFILTQSYYLASQYSAAFSLSEMLADRMKSLLALTRELNRSSERDSAIWTAIAEIRNVIRAKKEEITAYVPVRDSRLFQKISEDGPHVSIPVELSERLYSLSAPQSEGTIVRIPVRVSDVCLCVLEMNLTTSLQLEAMTREKPYVEGILDSLRLVLDNIQRVQRDALARIGQTASEIVHDINHHCKTIEAHTKTARMSPEAGAHAIAEIDREVTFMKNLAFDILDYAREQLIVRPVLEEITVVAHRIEEDLEEVFRDTQINHSVTENYKGTVRIDLERFRRVVLNLARNALTALGGNGRFSVSIEHQENACCFLFEDDGPGVSDDLTDLLFEPFASGGRGTGLGLAVVKRIIVAHGGDVRVSSTAGHGCRFLVELPA
ncbi:MAG: HAMP domain-containing histidine kinase, partial [Spirochaetia bacterium]|nr:HAMP domain-containing histidine kinase [Spirochaetia bacterium]